jgi:organic radical activating enzyme
MRDLYDINTIHIDITNACNLECANCTRFVGHHAKSFFMSLEEVETALKSLDGFEGTVGLMGGEPTMHPEFEGICKLFQQYVEKPRRGLWTNGLRWKKYEDVIKETFDQFKIIYNDHKDEDVGEHQPLLVAAKEIVEDEDTMWKLIDKCWINERWAASITTNGAFFCEVAAAQDHLFDGPGGYKVEPGWWKKSAEDYKDQVCNYCTNCSAAVPMPRYDAHDDKDLISPGNAKKLEESKSPKYIKGKYVIFDKTYSNEEIIENAKSWTPWSHRPYKQFGPDLIIKDDNSLSEMQ